MKERCARVFVRSDFGSLLHHTELRGLVDSIFPLDSRGREFKYRFRYYVSWFLSFSSGNLRHDVCLSHKLLFNSLSNSPLATCTQSAGSVLELIKLLNIDILK
jgi:hypothetical protein